MVGMFCGSTMCIFLTCCTHCYGHNLLCIFGQTDALAPEIELWLSIINVDGGNGLRISSSVILSVP